MIPDYEFRKGDTEPIFAQALTWSDGRPVDMTGATLSLVMRSLSSDAPVTLTGPVTSPTFGQIQYQPSTDDTTNIDSGPYLGNWKIVFADGTPQSFPTDGFLLINVEENLEGVLTIGARPQVAEVATFIRARTKVKGGSELGTFTADTRPTGDLVEAFIDDALDEVFTKVQPIDMTLSPGDPMGPGGTYEKRVRSTVAMYAAMLSEMSLQPEQVSGGQSVATMLQQRYESRVKALIAYGETGHAQGEGAGAGGAGDSPGDAYYSFPDCTPVPLTLEQLFFGSPAILPPGQIGLSTQW